MSMKGCLRETAAAQAQGHPYSNWRCTQTSAVTKSAPVCKDLGLLHIWFGIQRDMLELPGSRETQLVVLWWVNLLIWVDVKCEGDCGLQRWGHWNVHLEDNSGSCWKIRRSGRKTLMVALGRKGSGSNYQVRHFMRQFCTECQSSSDLMLGVVKLIATKDILKYWIVKLRGKCVTVTKDSLLWDIAEIKISSELRFNMG